MPLYEYKCTKCGHRFEKIESVSAAPTKKCPECGGRAERQLAAPALQFKGSGWYVTDYASKDPAKGSGDGSEAKPAAKAEEKPSEKKPAAKESAKKK